MHHEGIVLAYYESPFIYRNGWARKRRRKALRLAWAALLTPLGAYPLGLALSEILPRQGDLLALDVGVFAFILAICCSLGIDALLAIIGLMPSLDWRSNKITALLDCAATFTTTGPIPLFHAAWLHQRKRCVVCLCLVAVVMLAGTFLVAGITEQLLPTSGNFVDVPVAVLAAFGTVVLALAAGLFSALCAVALSRDKRIGRLPAVLGQGALVINTLLLVTALSFVAYGIFRRL